LTTKTTKDAKRLCKLAGRRPFPILDLAGSELRSRRALTLGVLGGLGGSLLFGAKRQSVKSVKSVVFCLWPA